MRILPCSKPDDDSEDGYGSEDGNENDEDGDENDEEEKYDDDDNLKVGHFLHPSPFARTRPPCDQPLASSPFSRLPAVSLVGPFETS